MARQRKNKDDEWMPPRVYRGKSAYEYHPKDGGCIRLCSLDAKKSLVWLEYEKHSNHTSIMTFRKLFELFRISPQYSEYSERTKLDHEQYARFVLKVFGNTSVNKIEIHHIRRYMDDRAKKTRVRANKEMSFMKVVFAWGMERNYNKKNPCIGIKKFTEKPRDRYITDAEYNAVFSIAPLPVQLAMEIAYLCAARQQDVLNLRFSECNDDGIFIQQGKTGKKQIKRWTSRLRDVINQSKRALGNNFSVYVIRNNQNKPYTSAGFRTIFCKVVAKAERDGLIKSRFTFHDIKHKSITDYKGDKQKFSGHSSKKMMEIYNHSVDVVDTLDKDKKIK